ncbi:hypothetical protein ACR1PO_16940 [Chryseobacterium sp. RRHN12]|uniref:hypothetical protein n=1 Tax=Chryseobacterium sp. RRHN12 TaxID=3437884 RepID=UPI003D9B373C
MKTLLLPTFFISATLTAQKKDNSVPVPQLDTTKMIIRISCQDILLYNQINHGKNCIKY